MERAIQQIQKQAKVGDRINLDLGGYSDEYAGNPVPITSTVEFLAGFGRDTLAVIGLGENNHVILTPQLM